jgi:glutaredoxin 3
LTRLVPLVTLYTTRWCGFCTLARRFLDARGIAYREVALDDDPAFRQRVFDLGRQWTVPLVVIGAAPIGGYRELVALEREGRLADLLDAPSAAAAPLTAASSANR